MQMFFEIFTDRLGDMRDFFVDVIGFEVSRADEGFLVLQRGTAKLHVASLDHMSRDQPAITARLRYSCRQTLFDCASGVHLARKALVKA